MFFKDNVFTPILRKNPRDLKQSYFVRILETEHLQKY